VLYHRSLSQRYILHSKICRSRRPCVHAIRGDVPDLISSLASGETVLKGDGLLLPLLEESAQSPQPPRDRFWSSLLRSKRSVPGTSWLS